VANADLLAIHDVLTDSITILEKQRDAQIGNRVVLEEGQMRLQRAMSQLDIQKSEK
jgi:hypothetical protein